MATATELLNMRVTPDTKQIIQELARRQSIRPSVRAIGLL